MDIDGPTFVLIVAFFTNLGQGLSQKVDFFLIFEQVVRPWLFRTRNPPLSSFLVFWRCIFTIFPKYYLKGYFFTKKAPYTVYHNHYINTMLNYTKFTEKLGILVHLCGQS